MGSLSGRRERCSGPAPNGRFSLAPSPPARLAATKLRSGGELATAAFVLSCRLASHFRRRQTLPSHRVQPIARCFRVPCLGAPRNCGRSPRIQRTVRRDCSSLRVSCSGGWFRATGSIAVLVTDDRTTGSLTAHYYCRVSPPPADRQKLPRCRL